VVRARDEALLEEAEAAVKAMADDLAGAGDAA